MQSSNYRDKTIFPSFSKIIERVRYQRFAAIDHGMIIPVKYQFGLK